MFRIYLFGDLRARIGDRALDAVSRHHTERLWVYLLLHAGETLRRRDVAETLWPDEARARFSLRHSLHHLRKHLPPTESAPPWLITDRATVGWNSEADYWLDAAAFENAVSEADGWADGRSATLPALEQAIDLCPRPLLSNLDEPWLVEARDRFESLLVSAMERAVTLYMDRGDLTSALATARRLLVRSPCREQTHRTLMVLHHRSGDRASALAQFEALRHMLADEFDAPPDAETVALAETIRAGRDEGVDLSSLTGAPRSAAQPTDGCDARGEGVPRHADRFIGRWRAARVVAMLSTTRLLTLTGPPGCGKSRVAAEAVADCVDHFADVRWLDLVSVTTAQEVWHALDRAIGVRPGTGADRSHGLSAAAGRPSLLVLDNCDGVVSTAADLAERTLRERPEWVVLATSRESLDVAGEVVWRVPLLMLPEPNVADGRVASSEAVRLLLDRAGRAGAAVSFGPGELAAVRTLCAGLDGLPAALERAAIALRSRPATDLAAQVDALLPFLDDQGPVADAPYASLSAAIETSYRRLTQRERALLRRLAELPRGFSLRDVEAVCASGGDGLLALGRDGVLDVLDGLVAKSLVLVDLDADASERYRILKVVRQFIRLEDCV